MVRQSLKNALLFNAALCALIGAVLIVDSGPIADLAAAETAVIPTWVVSAGGITLLLFAADLAFVATRRPIPRHWVKMLTAADLAFVVMVPVIMLVTAPVLTGVGQLLLAGLALLSAFCVWCQWRGLKQPESQNA